MDPIEALWIAAGQPTPNPTQDEESAATVGCLTDAEAAAMTVTAIYADATLGLGEAAPLAGHSSRR